MSRLSIYIIAAILLLFTAMSAYGYDTLSHEIAVPAGQAENKYQFQLNADETVQLDILNPTQAFSFVLNYNKVNNPPALNTTSPRDTPVFYLELLLVNETELPSNLDFNAVLRYKYYEPTLPCEPDNMEFLLYRSARWREFESVGSIDRPTTTLTQGFSRSELRPHGTHISVMGGNTLPVSSTDDFELYDQFGAVLTAAKTKSNTYQFQLGKSEVLHVEIQGSDRNFNWVATQLTENPYPNALFQNANKGLRFYKIEISGTTGTPIYNAGFRYDFVNSNLPSGMTVSTLKFQVYKYSMWTDLQQTPDVNTEASILTQGVSSLQDLTSSINYIAIAGTVNSPPTPTPSPTRSPAPPAQHSPTKPDPGTENPTPSGSHKQNKPDNSSSSSRFGINAVLSVVLIIVSMAVAVRLL